MEKDVALIYLRHGRPEVDLAENRFTYTKTLDDSLVFRSFVQRPEDDTFQRVNEVAAARSRGEALPYTNLLRLRREGDRFVAECYFEGPRMTFYNGKPIVLDTGKAQVAVSESGRAAIQKLLAEQVEV